MQIWKFQKKIHSSWVIAVMCLGLVAGAMISPQISQTYFASWLWLVAAILLISVVLWRGSAYLLPVALVAGAWVGLWRGSVLVVQVADYAAVYGHIASVSGRIIEDPDIGKDTNLQIKLVDVSIDGHNMAGKVWLSLAGQPQLKRGDVVRVKGLVEQGFGSFTATMYRAQLMDAKRPVPGDVALRVRDWFADKIRMGISEPQASLGLGYLLGQKRALPPELSEALVITGLTHVVVASGYNLTILVRLARRVFARVSKYLSTLSATAMILSFMAITGSSPSMTRAGLVSGLSLAAWYYGRKFHPLVLLPFAAAVTVMIDPTYAWNDLGWQLSFSAFAGVMILAPLGQRYFFGDKPPGTIRQILGETVSAQIATLPVLVYVFGQMSNVAVLANLMVLPLVPLAMLLVFATGVCGTVLPALVQVVGAPADWLLNYMVHVVYYFADLPWALMNVQITLWQLGLAYAIMILLVVYLWRVTKYNLRDSNIVE